MKLLLVKNGKNQYELLSPETYGMSTWGSNHQVSLTKKTKFWYIQSWTAGNCWVDDVTYETKLNVVKETSDMDEIFRYLIEHNVKEIQPFFEETRKIYNEYIDFMKCINRGEE